MICLMQKNQFRKHRNHAAAAYTLVGNALSGGVNGTSDASVSISIDEFDSKGDAFIGSTA